MPAYEPDPALSASPLLATLPAGSRLWRLHARRFAPGAFNPTVPRPLAGGRFDNDDGSFAHLYAGADHVVAVAETLLRDRPRATAALQVPRRRLQEVNISVVELGADLSVVQLHGPGLSAVGQDAWLTACSPAEYPMTRRWARALRAWAPDAAGLQWRARHDTDRLAYVFFSDRVLPGVIRAVTGASWPVDAPGRGFDLVRGAARLHNARAVLP